MKPFFLLIIVIVLFMSSPAQDLPLVSSGKIIRIENFQSQYVSARHVDVWLPEGYTDKKKFNVLYMHDGQMLFDSTKTWNKQEWGVDEVMGSLLDQGKIHDVIVVAIWNGGFLRHAEYFPQAPFESLSTNQKDYVSYQLVKAGKTIEYFQPLSDNYLKFIVYELKPYIEANFSVYKGRKHNFIAGSSMGGMISLYAICEYPGVFGGAACLSTHWTGIYTWENNPVPNAMIDYLKVKLPDPKAHKIYFDYGDQTLDSLYAPAQKDVDEVMKLKGYTAKNWETLYFTGKDHSEKSWNERFNLPVLFLLEE